MAEAWPAALFPSAQDWSKSGASATGGRTLTGGQQVVRSDAGFWACTMTLDVRAVGRLGEDQTLGYRAMMAQLDGMAGEIDVPCTPWWRPYDANGRMLRGSNLIFPGGRTLFNHSAFEKETVPLMFARGSVERGATRMTIRHPDVQGLRPGHYFGIGHRLYIVARAWQIEYEGGGVGNPVLVGSEPVHVGDEPVVDGLEAALSGENVEVIDFWPRLREDVATGTPLILDRPLCRMRLASDDTGRLMQAAAQIAQPTLEFVEAI